jgi:signal peptidase
LVLAAFAVLLAFAAARAAGYEPQVVKSGSMRPMLERGSVVWVRPTPVRELHVGQVITFQNPIKRGSELVTHRIVAIKSLEGKRVFETKGDANTSRDPWNAQISHQAGVLKAHVPYMGRLSFIAHDRNGFIGLFAAPVILLALFALWKIWRRPARAASAPMPPPPPPVSPDQVSGVA